jgi:ABC-type lipoprotein release transport system permease subunit
MRTLMRMAWRNLFRNTRRTLITGSAIGVGLAALVLTLSFVEGFYDYMVESATDLVLGHGQLHRLGYRDTLSASAVIPNGPDWLRWLRQQPSVQAASARVRASGLLARSTYSALVDLLGVQPDAEAQVTRLYRHVVAGHYLAGQPREVLLGKKLADKLHAKLGDKLVLTVAQPFTGEQNELLLRLRGIFQTGNLELDGAMALLNAADADRALGLSGQFQEIAFRLKRPADAEEPGLPLWQPQQAEPPAPFSSTATAGVRAPTVSAGTGAGAGGGIPGDPPGAVANSPGNADVVEIVPWPVLEPLLSKSLGLFVAMTLAMTVITGGIIGVGILNTLLMSLFERTQEFGILRALGTPPRSIALLIVLEATFLGLIATVLGSVLAACLNGYFSVQGINYGGISFGGVVFEDRSMYAVWSAAGFAGSALAVLLMTVLFSLYPAWRASRVLPAEAMRPLT